MALLKDSALSMVKGALLEDEYTGCSFRFAPAFVAPLRRLRHAVATRGIAVLSFDGWRDLLDEVWGISPREVGKLDSVILSHLGCHVVYPSSKGSRRMVVAAGGRAAPYRATVLYAERLLRRRFPNGLLPEEILDKLPAKAKHDLSVTELKNVLTAIPGLERSLAGGRFRLSLASLGRISDQLERILATRGAPMGMRELAEELSQYKGRKGSKRTPRHLAVIMSDDARFKCIGRSGIWGLTEWDFETNKITDLAAFFLRASNQAMTEEELYRLILARRPVGTKSVRTVLRDDPRFRRTGRRSWELKDRTVGT
jgi:hypothetical protein